MDLLPLHHCILLLAFSASNSPSCSTVAKPAWSPSPTVTVSLGGNTQDLHRAMKWHFAMIKVLTLSFLKAPNIALKALEKFKMIHVYV